MARVFIRYEINSIQKNILRNKDGSSSSIPYACCFLFVCLVGGDGRGGGEGEAVERERGSWKGNGAWGASNKQKKGGGRFRRCGACLLYSSECARTIGCVKRGSTKKEVLLVACFVKQTKKRRHTRVHIKKVNILFFSSERGHAKKQNTQNYRRTD